MFAWVAFFLAVFIICTTWAYVQMRFKTRHAFAIFHWCRVVRTRWTRFSAFFASKPSFDELFVMLTPSDRLLYKTCALTFRSEKDVQTFVKTLPCAERVVVVASTTRRGESERIYIPFCAPPHQISSTGQISKIVQQTLEESEKYQGDCSFIVSAYVCEANGTRRDVTGTVLRIRGPNGDFYQNSLPEQLRLEEMDIGKTIGFLIDLAEGRKRSSRYGRGNEEPATLFVKGVISIWNREYSL